MASRTQKSSRQRLFAIAAAISGVAAQALNTSVLNVTGPALLNSSDPLGALDLTCVRSSLPSINAQVELH